MPDDLEYLLSWYLIILRQYRVLPWTVPCNWPHERYQAVKGQPMGTVKCCYNAVRIYHDITIGTAMTAAECKSDFIIITDSHTSPSRASYRVSMVKIWENKKWLCYNAIVLYLVSQGRGFNHNVFRETVSRSWKWRRSKTSVNIDKESNIQIIFVIHQSDHMLYSNVLYNNRPVYCCC